MHILWKYFLILIMIEIAIMITIYKSTLRLENNFPLHVHKDIKYLRFSGPEENSGNSTQIEESDKLVHNPKYDLNYTLNSLQKNKRMKSQRIPDKFRKRAPLMRTTKNKNDSTMEERNNVLESKKNVCTFSFEKESLMAAKRLLNSPKEESVYLFYIHISIDSNDGLSSLSNEQKDALQNWQYVLKDEKFLVRLPVDFDLITFDLLLNDHEEEILELKTFYNVTNCKENPIESIRFQLWSELFENNTDYNLCNRHFLSETERKVLYYITTIWIGFDLTCSEAPTENGIKTSDVEKDNLPLVAPIFCFLLSFEFVWLFVILDIPYSKIKSSDEIKNQIKSLLSYYQKGDSPYSLKRMTLKIFFSDCPRCCSSCNVNEDIECKTCQTNCCKKENCQICCKSFCRGCFCCCTAKRRLTLLLWTFILLPSGLYRTLGRYCLNKNVYREYLNVVRTSEPLFDLIPNDTIAMTLDVLYACFFPVAFIWLGAWLYDTYMDNIFDPCSLLNYSEEANQTKGKQFTALNNRFVSRCDNLYANYRTLCNCGLSCKEYCKQCFCECPSCKCCNGCECNSCGHSCIECFKQCFCDCPPCKCCKCNSCGHSCKECFKQCFCDCPPCKYCKCNSCGHSCKECFKQCFCDSPPCKCCKCNSYGHSCKECCQQCFCDRQSSCCKFCEDCKCNCKICLLFDSLFQLLFCLFPFFLFTTHAFKKASEDRSACFIEYCTNKSKSKNNEGCLNCLCSLICYFSHFLLWLLFYCLCLRPIVSSITFILRFITYFVFVVLPIRIHIFRYTLIGVTAALYFAKYFKEIVSMNTEILEHLFSIIEEDQIKKNYPDSNTTNSHPPEEEDMDQRQKSSDEHESQNPEGVAEDMFDNIYINLLFVKRRLYFFCMKSIIVFMYLFITVETFMNNRKYLSSTSFKDILEVALVLIGPYAISLFLKADDKKFLTDENKEEIKNTYKKYKDYLNSVKEESRELSERKKEKIKTSAEIHETRFGMEIETRHVSGKQPSESDPLLPKTKH